MLRAKELEASLSSSPPLASAEDQLLRPEAEPSNWREAPAARVVARRRAVPKQSHLRPAVGLAWQNLAIIAGGLLLFGLYSHCEVEVPVHVEVPVQIQGDVIIVR